MNLLSYEVSNRRFWSRDYILRSIKKDILRLYRCEQRTGI